MFDYIDCLGLDFSLKKSVVKSGLKKENKIKSLAYKFANSNKKCLVKENNLTRLAVVIESLKYTKQKYDALGIDEKIFVDTMSDIKIWCQENNNKGLENSNWLFNHINCELFKIGRLQFQLYKCNNPTLKYKYLPFEKGDSLVYIHIPTGEKLSLEECKKSIVESLSFFKRYFPDYNYRYYFCESWLIYENNKEFMKPDSNIVKFSQLFNIAYSVDVDAQAIERIFKKRRLFKSNYPENTSLQKSAKEYIITGGKLGIGIGYIDKNDYSSLL